MRGNIPRARPRTRLHGLFPAVIVLKLCRLQFSSGKGLCVGMSCSLMRLTDRSQNLLQAVKGDLPLRDRRSPFILLVHTNALLVIWPKIQHLSCSF